MTTKLKIVLACCVFGALAAPGCGPDQKQIQTSKALTARVDRQPTYNESARFVEQTYLAMHDRDYVMWAMDYSSLCMMSGNYDAAKAELTKCYDDIQKREDTNKDSAAAVSNEALKLFKGEPFERAMVCTYLGILNYMDGDFNTARIFCARADMEDATTEENMADFRHDFGLAQYWLGRSYLKLGNEGNARVAFTLASQHVARKNEAAETAATQKRQAGALDKRAKLEKESYQLATTAKPPVAGAVDMSNTASESQLPATLAKAGAASPVIQAAASREEFFSVPFQKEVNLIVMIETGIGPVKYLTGPEGCMDAIRRGPYEERKTIVYLDGHKAGAAMPALDLFHQADTRGMSDKDKLQISKGLSKAILKQLPYAGSVAGHWDVRADWRYWRLMPGEVHLFAAKVKPGLYTINVQCLDSNSNLLPRYSLTRYAIPVKEGQENIYFLNTKPEADNTYVQVEK
jgi:hypothetical protein